MNINYKPKISALKFMSLYMDASITPGPSATPGTTIGACKHVKHSEST